MSGLFRKIKGGGGMGLVLMLLFLLFLGGCSRSGVNSELEAEGTVGRIFAGGYQGEEDEDKILISKQGVDNLATKINGVLENVEKGEDFSETLGEDEEFKKKVDRITVDENKDNEDGKEDPGADQGEAVDKAGIEGEIDKRIEAIKKLLTDLESEGDLEAEKENLKADLDKAKGRLEDLKKELNGIKEDDKTEIKRVGEAVAAENTWGAVILKNRYLLSVYKMRVSLTQDVSPFLVLISKRIEDFLDQNQPVADKEMVLSEARKKVIEIEDVLRDGESKLQSAQSGDEQKVRQDFLEGGKGKVEEGRAKMDELKGVILRLGE